MILLIFLFLLICGVCANGKNSLIVDTTVGQIRGVRGEDFSMFLGIPYGKVDEKKPFATATPYPYFTTLYEANNDSAICPQILGEVVTGTIDCLHLNIYTPINVTHKHALPVMVYLHGGAFVQGNGALSSYSPKFLIKHNVIVVTVNYRLGPYGFLCFPNSEYSNQGLKDQILALKWVKDNIKSFGGDSENVLLIGHSAGSILADFHLLYNNDGLFNKVILQSGQAIMPYVNEDTHLEFNSVVAKKIGMDTENINVEEFIAKLSKLLTKNELFEISKTNIFRPCIDEILLTKTQKNKDLKNIKIISGATVKEGLFFCSKETDAFFESYDFFAELSKGFFNVTGDAMDVIKHFYFDNLKDNLIDFISDFAFHYPTERSVKYYLKNNSTVYRYLFAYDGGRNYVKIRDNITDKGPTHGDELGYLFDIGQVTRLWPPTPLWPFRTSNRYN